MALLTQTGYYYFQSEPYEDWHAGQKWLLTDHNSVWFLSNGRVRFRHRWNHERFQIEEFDYEGDYVIADGIITTITNPGTNLERQLQWVAEAPGRIMDAHNRIYDFVAWGDVTDP